MNSSLSATHCLLVTHLPLTDLRHSAHGTFRRLCLLAQGMQRSGFPLTVVTTVEAATPPEDLPQMCLRIEQDLRALWNVEATVKLAPQAPPSKRRWLQQQLMGLTGYSRSPWTRTLLSQPLYSLLDEEISSRPRFIVAHRLFSMFALLRFRNRLPPVYFDMDDIEHVVHRRSVGTERKLREKLILALSLPSLLLAERRAVRTARRTFVCSGDDARRLCAMFAVDSVGVLPNAVSIPAPIDAADGQVVLMVGAYSYGPNADGANFFVEQIWPLIRERMPQAELWFAGAGSEALAAYRAPPANVRFLGFVDDLAAVYKAARLVICPIRYGGGTRVKLIEAAAWGKPIVSTVVGAEGLGMKHEQDVLFADQPRDFADACLRLMGDPALCDRLGRNARRLASEQFDREQILQRLTATFAA